MNPRNFFAELERRSVYKVAAAYETVEKLSERIRPQISQISTERRFGRFP
jgi:hypothetical protein